MISLRNLSNPNLVGHRICDLLEQQGSLTQASLGMQIGVPRGTISKYLTALTAEGYTYIANSITYAKPSASKGIRSGVILLYARTTKPLPIPREDREELTAVELHQIMCGIVQRGKPD
ncbi:hypothetical protein BCO18175_02339 [Burkholderia contaminans]|uniref:hypothetical protein n=1 Tax=Burkholderia contaminans TaxID=488447 RepID=UPI0014539528|nr:hypothetical protein [Burkholderia contaminans]ELK6464643.1 hypothetical protein [Burkholderia contaminans]VWC75608.1 hypothetical protein BCO18175_02339 [Burkholderia contaminans]